MKQAKDLIHKNTPSHEVPEPTESGEKEMAERLLKAMAINYGAIFKAELDSAQAQNLWVKSWTASLRGKNPDIVIKAIKHCMDTHPRPFTKADFQMAYRALKPGLANRTQQQPLGLPSKTWQEHKEIGRKHLAKIKEIVRR